MKLKLISLFLALVASVGTMFASDTQVDGIWYIFNSTDQTAKVTYKGDKCTSNAYIGDVIIPESVIYEEITYSITSIGSSAFYGSSLTSITIPNSVTSLKQYAFYECLDLTSIVIPSNVNDIGAHAFANSSNLKSITCEAVTPPALGSGVFFAVKKSIPLYVPEESIDAYKAADQWKDFTNIQPMKEDPAPCITASGTCGAEGDNLTWELSCEGVLTISGTGEMADYSSFPQPWYENRDAIKSVIIEDGVTSIGEYAFAGCSGLTSITIPNSVTSIERYAFSNCSGLTSIEIPNSVTSIGEAAFSGCAGLTSVTIGSSVTSIGDRAFYDCAGLTSFTIPNSVTSIGQWAFSYCTGLTSPVYNAHVFAYMPTSYSGAYTIPDGIESISGGAFQNCSGLTSIEIPNSVTSIGNEAFYKCSGLTSITCEATTPPTLEGNVFYNVDKSIPLYVPAESIDLYKAADQWKDFTNIQAIKCITASGTCGAEGDNLTWELSCDGVLTISGTGDMADYEDTNNSYAPWYSYRSAITQAIITNGVTSIGNYVFSRCSLQSVTIPNSVTRIGDGAFNMCVLESITIPNSVTEIGSLIFWACGHLTSAILPDNITSISAGMFGMCKNLSSITIPNSVVSIEENAFNSCYALTSIVIPSSVANIGNRAFAGCDGLTSVTIPSSVTSIGKDAFGWCYGLTSVTIPNSVTSIGSYAFYYCTGLTSVTNYASTPQSIYSSVFDNVNISACTLYVPEESIDAYKAADVWKEFGKIEALDETPGEDPVETIPGDYSIYYVDKEKQELSDEVVTLHVPVAPVITGFTFVRWQAYADDIKDGITIQAVYQADVPASSPAVYTNPSNPAQKLIRNGNVYILTDDSRTYTITGQQVK